MGAHSVFEMLCSLVFRIPNDGQSKKNVILIKVFVKFIHIQFTEVTKLFNVALLWVNASCCVYNGKMGKTRPPFATTFQRAFSITRARISMTCHIFILASFHMYN
jgi:hypothetical protein